jgi:hypothetical protein
LALANNPTYYAEVLNGPPGAVWSGANQKRWFDAIGPTVAGLSEPAADRRLRSNALALCRARPRDFARASAARLARFWSARPAGAVYPGRLRALVALWTIPLWVALVAGLSSRALWCWPRVAAPAMLLGLSAVHAFYWTDMRMRAPLVPAIALIVASSQGPCLWLSRYNRMRPATTAMESRKKFEKPAGFCCSIFGETLGLMTAALGGKTLVSRFWTLASPERSFRRGIGQWPRSFTSAI